MLPLFVFRRGKTMRNLQTHDVFKALKIANSAGIKEEFQKIAFKMSSGKKISEKELGFDFIMNVLANCADEKTERLIYDFIGGLLEEDAEEIRVMNPLELFDKIKALKEVISVEDWKAFFISLSAVMK